MIKIYHNPRCSKSREGLALLEASGKEFEVIKYLEDIPTKEELRNILHLLDLPTEELVRKNETIWKDKYRGTQMTEEDILDAMIENPKLIERPIVVMDHAAVIGRPPENIKRLIA